MCFTVDVYLENEITSYVLMIGNAYIHCININYLKLLNDTVGQDIYKLTLLFCI